MSHPPSFSTFQGRAAGARLDSPTASLLITRVAAGRPPLSVRVRPPLSTFAAAATSVAGSGAAESGGEGPAAAPLGLAEGVRELEQVLRESTGAGARFKGASGAGAEPAAAAASTSGSGAAAAQSAAGTAEARDWWRRRFAQDKRLGSLLASADSSWLGPWRSLVLGASVSEAAGGASTPQWCPPAGLSPECSEALRLLSLAAAAGAVSEAEVDAALDACGLTGAAADAARRSVLEAARPAAAGSAQEQDDVSSSTSTTSRARGAAAAGGAKRGAAKASASASASDAPAASPPQQPPQRGPVLLLLDWDLQGIPWESFPSLMGEMVYRVPSLSAAAASVAAAQAAAAQAAAAAAAAALAARPVDLERTWYVLNPSGDLPSTQQTFQGWFAGTPGWEGVSGREPDPSEHLAALSTHDLFVYFGHGGGQQLAPAAALRRLGRCAAGLLMGCSSGAAARRGEYPPALPAMGYLIAGSPAAVANLWDVTDKDIDRFSTALLRSWFSGGGGGGEQDGDGAAAGGGGDSAAPAAKPAGKGRGKAGRLGDGADGPRTAQQATTDMLRGLAEARAATKLPSLTGAAPVCYGLPTALIVPPWGAAAAAKAATAAEASSGAVSSSRRGARAAAAAPSASASAVPAAAVGRGTGASSRRKVAAPSAEETAEDA